MCNLYRMTASRDEVAHFFAAVAEDMVSLSGNAPGEIYPGYPGVVLADGALRQMTWGFPYARIGAKGQKLKPRPVNNAREDKLSGPFWSASFRSRRCLIPVTEFAEAEGPSGGKTRTWFSLPGEPVFAVAGLWRDTAEWGPAYTMVMTAACQYLEGVHDRMPVILMRDEWHGWLGEDHRAARLLCRPFEHAMEVRRTSEPWSGWR